MKLTPSDLVQPHQFQLHLIGLGCSKLPSFEEFDCKTFTVISMGGTVSAAAAQFEGPSCDEGACPASARVGFPPAVCRLQLWM